MKIKKINEWSKNPNSEEIIKETAIVHRDMDEYFQPYLKITTTSGNVYFTKAKGIMDFEEDGKGV